MLSASEPILQNRRIVGDANPAVTTTNMSHEIIKLSREVVAAEIAALQRMSERMGPSVVEAAQAMLACRGRVIIIGMGKSGIIGRKIAATFASTGTPSFFVHPGEAFHGDLGMIKPIDLALMISNSGETEELIRLLPFLQEQGNRIVTMTGGLQSTLASHAHIVLDVSVEREACNNNLAPTSSTTATLVMGDALAVSLATLRGFQPEDFARFHPGGSLGRRLLTRVKDVMHRAEPAVCPIDASFHEVVRAISRGRCGIALIVDDGVLCGVITDGDLRRAFEAHDDIKAVKAHQIMTPSPHVIAAEERFAAAEERMRELNVKSLVVVDERRHPTGILQFFDA